jgi:hypothetical protein
MNLAPYGSNSKLNITGPTVVKAAPGRLATIAVMAPGTGGTLAVHDCAAVADANASNLIFEQDNTTQTRGTIETINWPCLVGITVAQVTTGGAVAIAYE